MKNKNSKTSNNNPDLPVEPISEQKTPIRDNLESIVLAILMVLIVRQVVVEAFKIPTGSMAPTLLGIHKEVRCPNCGYTFRVGSGEGNSKVGPEGYVACQNCRYEWPGAGREIPNEYGTEEIIFRRPAWLWNRGKTAVGKETIKGLNAANRIDRWGSRILVNKFVYKLREPRRWEIIVFKYPYGPKNYIKRLVGLPGETISIKNGDVYIDGSIARKPPSIQNSLWVDVFDSRFIPEKEISPRWEFGEAKSKWEENPENGSLTLKAANSKKPVLANYARPIRDFYAYDGFMNQPLYNKGNAAEHRVDDVRLNTTLRIKEKSQNTGYVILNIKEDQNDFSLHFPIFPNNHALLKNKDNVIDRKKIKPLDKNQLCSLTLENYDEKVVAKVNRDVIITYEYDSGGFGGRPQTRVSFGVTGAEVLFKRIKIKRDIYYTNSSKYLPEHTYKLGEKEYFVLGDNSPYSKDSREWKEPIVPEKNLIGRAFAVFWPVHEMKVLPSGKKSE